jgi:Arc/MetJ-type ribon-helix-helix transcriptional regulator
VIFYILFHMKSVLIELDDEVAARLEQVAPGRSRRRSEFIRNAIREALWHLEEQATAEAYRRQPDSPDVYVSSDVWEPAGQKKPRGRRR